MSQNPTGRPTHFLALYLGSHSAELRTRIEALHDRIFALSPAFERQALEPAVRCHLTCGVMRLENKARINAALDLLQECREPLLHTLAGRTLKVRFDGLGGFPEGSVHSTRVLWLRPHSTDDQPDLLYDFATSLNNEFSQAGFITTQQPLTLHATLVKVPPTRRHRFEAEDLLNLNADLGTYEVPRVSLCKMGAYDQSGVHIEVGGIDILPPADEDEGGPRQEEERV